MEMHIILLLVLMIKASLDQIMMILMKENLTMMRVGSFMRIVNYVFVIYIRTYMVYSLALDHQ